MSSSVTPTTTATPATPTTTDSTTTPDRTGSAPAPDVRGRPRLDWRLRFAALSLIWGFSFLLIKVGTQGYAPFQVTLGRLAFGTAVLAVAMAVRREGLPRGARTWGHLAVAGFLLNALPFSLFAFAELTIPSTLAGICNATSPLWGMALSLVALREDRPTRVRVAGLGLGFLGVLTVLGAWQGFDGLDARGTTLALLASLSYPVGWIYVRRTLAGSSHSHLSLTGGQLLLATVQLAVVTPLFTSVPSSLAVGPLLAIAALGTLGTGLAVLVQYGIVAEVGPTTGQMVTYFVPVIAAAAGILLLGETLTWSTPVGAAVVLAGAALTQVKPKRAR
ncbi:DMT family transporter [Streptomyces sp. R02]|uniref:DMT family transporter n=1 Tax=Streptomyces sp. R02 TaxID=3238623 RepID=A0AB39LHM0_9ACTN